MNHKLSTLNYSRPPRTDWLRVILSLVLIAACAVLWWLLVRAI